jgi:hypothetical protein
MSDYNWAGHDPDCLMRRYCSLPFETREYWPEGFSSRPQLCTCGIVPGSEAMQPEYADDRRELEEWLSHR